LQYGAIRFARHKKRLLARFSHYAPLKRLIWRDSAFKRHYIPLIGAIPARALVGKEIFLALPLGLDYPARRQIIRWDDGSKESAERCPFRCHKTGPKGHKNVTKSPVNLTLTREEGAQKGKSSV